MKNQEPCTQWSDLVAVSDPARDLSADEYRMLQEHVAQCPACATTQKHYREMATHIRSLTLPHVASAGNREGALSIQARLFLASERYEEALTITTSIFRCRYNSASGWQIKAQASYFLGRYQEAVHACTCALEFSVGTDTVWDLKCRSLLRLKHYHEAAKVCKHALRIYGSHVGLWYLHLSVLFLLGQQAEEQCIQNDLFELDPNYIVNYRTLDEWIDRSSLLCLREPWRYEEMLEVCCKTLQLDPTKKIAWEIKGRALIALGLRAMDVQRKSGTQHQVKVLFEMAQDAFEHSLALKKESADTWRFLGWIFDWLEQHSQAQKAYRLADEFDSDQEEGWELRTTHLIKEAITKDFVCL